MKKLLLCLALIMPLIAFTGCGKDDDEPKGSSINNTKWVMSSIGGARYDYFVFEFKASSFECYTSDSNLVPLGEPKSGTYSLKDSEVNLNGFIIRSSLWQEVRFEKGTLSGNKMTFRIQFRSLSTDGSVGEWHDWPNAVTLIKR